MTQDRGAEGPRAVAVGKGAGAGLGGWKKMLSGHPPSRSQMDSLAPGIVRISNSVPESLPA